jgi:hypothetical protein
MGVETFTTRHDIQQPRGMTSVMAHTHCRHADGEPGIDAGTAQATNVGEKRNGIAPHAHIGRVGQRYLAQGSGST